MNIPRQLLIATTLFATLSAGIVPTMAAEPTKKTVPASEEIPMLPPIIVIGKRLTPEEKAIFAQQERSSNLKKVARKKNETNGLPAFNSV